MANKDDLKNEDNTKNKDGLRNEEMQTTSKINN